VIFTERARTAEVRAALAHYFPAPAAGGGSAGGAASGVAPPAPPAALDERVGFGVQAGLTQRVIVTRVGPGPEVLGSDAHLADVTTGLPL